MKCIQGCQQEMLSPNLWAKTTISNINISQCTMLRSGMTDTADTYQMSTLSQVPTDVNKHLQTAEQTIIRERANRRSLCWTEDFLPMFSGLSALTLSQWHRLTAWPWSDNKGCDGWITGLHQKKLRETSWTWNTSLSVKTRRWEAGRTRHCNVERLPLFVQTERVMVGHALFFKDRGQGFHKGEVLGVGGGRGHQQGCVSFQGTGGPSSRCPFSLVLNYCQCVYMMV